MRAHLEAKTDWLYLLLALRLIFWQKAWQTEGFGSRA